MSNSPFDLFNQPSKKPKPAPKPAAAPRPVSQPHPSAPPRPQPIERMKTAEFRKAFKKIEQMHDELDKQLGETYQRSGLSLERIKSFLENPNNFNKIEWERVQKERLSRAERIWSIVGEEAKTQMLKEVKKKSAEEKKGKFLGSRKKWIPMR